MNDRNFSVALNGANGGRNLKRDIAVFLLIIVFGLLLRALFFSGLIGSDDLAYAQNAHDLLSGKYSPKASPFWNRIGYIVLLAGVFRVFGINEFALVIPPFLASLLQIFLAFLFLHRAGKKRAGFIAAGIMAVVPWDVIFATRGYPDVPAGVAFSAFVFLVWRGGKTDKPLSFGASFIAGLLLSVTYMIKEMVLLQLLFWAPFLIYLTWKNKGISSATLALMIAGAGLPWLIESVCYQFLAGDFFYRLHGISAGYNQTIWSGIGMYGKNLLHRVLVEAPLSLLLDSAFLQCFAAGLIAYLFLRGHDKKLWPIFMWLACDLAFFAFGTTSFKEFNPLALDRRYMLIMVLPAVLLIGAGIDRGITAFSESGERIKIAIAIFVFTALTAIDGYFQPGFLVWLSIAAFSLGIIFALLRFENAFRIALIAGAAAFVVYGMWISSEAMLYTAQPEKQAYRFIQQDHVPIYADEKTKSILEFFDGYKQPIRFHDFSEIQTTEISNSFLIINEHRISFLMNTYQYKLPDRISEAASKMKLMKTFGMNQPGRKIYIFKAD